MRTFRFEKNDDLPRLAWCAQLYRESEEIVVEHGPWVETRPGCFYAGAWSGPMDGARPDEAVSCCGTGARLDSEICIFFASTNLFDRLYVKRMPGGLAVSNSLTYVLVKTDDEPVPTHFMYSERFYVFLLQGIRRQDRSLPYRRGEVEVYECCNLKVAADLALERCEKPVPDDPLGDYQQYVRFLESQLRSVIDNASDPGRAVTFRPMVTVSKGYDSNALAVLARRWGATDAITFSEETPGTPNPDDGTAVAEILGFKVHKFGKQFFSSSEKFPEAEFLACPPGWGSPYGSTENLIPGTLVTNGMLGDLILSPDRRALLPDLAKGEAGGAAYTSNWEYRLRTGSLDFPLYYAGWQRSAEVHAITVSSEMHPWSVGGDYDRPIPRRILEEAGVPRELFGQTKYAGMIWELSAREKFRPGTWADIEEFTGRHCEEHRLKRMEPTRCLYHWAFSRTRERYDRALHGRGDDPLFRE